MQHLKGESAKPTSIQTNPALCLKQVQLKCYLHSVGEEELSVSIRQGRLVGKRETACSTASFRFKTSAIFFLRNTLSIKLERSPMMDRQSHFYLEINSTQHFYLFVIFVLFCCFGQINKQTNISAKDFAPTAT